MNATRIMIVGNILYKADEYPQLKDFYQKVNAKDKEPAVLQFTRPPGTAATGTGK